MHIVNNIVFYTYKFTKRVEITLCFYHNEIKCRRKAETFVGDGNVYSIDGYVCFMGI